MLFPLDDSPEAQDILESSLNYSKFDGRILAFV